MSARTETIKSTVYGIVTDTDSGLDVQTFDNESERDAALVEFVMSYWPKDEPVPKGWDIDHLWEEVCSKWCIDSYILFEHEIKSAGG